MRGQALAVGGGSRCQGQWRGCKGGQLGYMEIYAKNIPDLTDPRTICSQRIPSASAAAGKLSQLRWGASAGSVNLLRSLHQHREGFVFAHLGAALSLPALPDQRKLFAFLCSTVSPG